MIEQGSKVDSEARQRLGRSSSDVQDENRFPPRPPWFVPDSHRFRPPLPYSAKECTDWEQNRRIGKTSFVRRATMAATLIIPVVTALICYGIYWIERPVLDARFFRIAWPYALFVFPGAPILGWYLGTMLWHIGEDRYYAATNMQSEKPHSP